MGLSPTYRSLSPSYRKERKLSVVFRRYIADFSTKCDEHRSIFADLSHVSEKLFSTIFEINYEFFMNCFETSFNRYFFIFFRFFSKGESKCAKLMLDRLQTRLSLLILLGLNNNAAWYYEEGRSCACFQGRLMLNMIWFKPNNWTVSPSREPSCTMDSDTL